MVIRLATAGTPRRASLTGISGDAGADHFWEIGPAVNVLAGWPPAVQEGKNASPGGLRPGSPSIGIGEEPGPVPSRGKALTRMRFPSDTHCRRRVPGRNDDLINPITPMHLVDPPATNYSRRFYRAVLQ